MPKPTERQIQEAVADFLTIDGWRRIRTDLGHLRGLGVMEKGIPDDLFIRYGTGCIDDSWAQVLWIEFKAPGRKPKNHQAAWHLAEEARGALIWVVDDYDEFRVKYMASGLNRRIKR